MIGRRVHQPSPGFTDKCILCSLQRVLIFLIEIHPVNECLRSPEHNITPSKSSNSARDLRVREHVDQ